ncbi:MAG: hypothetical protein IKX00_01185 [Bacilli bacterium]|nr:hypothetical protein [Bacilli bacterium]
MNQEEINQKIKEINTEDMIWIVYIGIIFLSFVSNHFERKYYLNNDINSREKYQKILIFIFSVLLIVYIYFLKGSIDSIKKLKETDSKKKKEMVYLSFIASLLIAISGVIFLYIAIIDDNLDVELAFN